MISLEVKKRPLWLSIIIIVAIILSWAIAITLWLIFIFQAHKDTQWIDMVAAVFTAVGVLLTLIQMAPLIFPPGVPVGSSVRRPAQLDRQLLNMGEDSAAYFPYVSAPVQQTYDTAIQTLRKIRKAGSAKQRGKSGLLILGAVVGIWLTVVLPRRVFLISSFAVTCASLLALSLISAEQVGALIAAFAVFTLAMSAVSNLVGVYPPECFPTDLRARGVGLAIACSRLGSAAGTFLLPIAMARFGLQPAMMALAAVLLLGMLVSIAWAPETRLLRLNEASSV